MPPRKKKTASEAAEQASAAGLPDARKRPSKKANAVQLPNALKRPSKKGFVRDEDPPADLEAAGMADAGQERLRQLTSAGQIASGRGATYEWEFFVGDVETRLRTVEQSIDTGGAASVTRYTHVQTLPSSSWAITHALATKPGVTVVAVDGQELLAEVFYPDDDHTVIVFGQPYAGTAYLRG